MKRLVLVTLAVARGVGIGQGGTRPPTFSEVTGATPQPALGGDAQLYGGRKLEHRGDCDPAGGPA